MVFTERQKGELKEISKEMSKEVLRELTLDSRFLDTLADKLVNKILDQLSPHIENLKDRISDLEKKVNNVVGEKEYAKMKCDQLEQQSKMKQLRLHGVLEEMNNDLKKSVEDIFVNKLGVENIVINDCFRLGTATDGKIRPIIVNFENLQHRNLVFFNKKKLKGSKIVITEELVKSTYELLLCAKERLGKDKVWTIGGKIITKLNGKKSVIKTEEDVLKLMDNHRG